MCNKQSQPRDWHCNLVSRATETGPAKPLGAYNAHHELEDLMFVLLGLGLALALSMTLFLLLEIEIFTLCHCVLEV